MTAPSTAAAWRAFDLFRRPWMALRVRTHLAGASPLDRTAGPVVLVANHESFWDGFLLREVQRALRPRGSFHAVMLDRELEFRGWLRALGAIGVTPGSTASGRRLLHALDDLRHDAVLAYFPQGRLWPGSPRPVRFMDGVAAVCRRLAPLTVVPVGLRVVQGRTPRSEAYVSVGEPVSVRWGAAPSVGALEELVAAQVDAVGGFLARHGEDAPDHWPRDGAHLPPATPSWLSGSVPEWVTRN